MFTVHCDGRITGPDIPAGYCLAYSTRPEPYPDPPWENSDCHGDVRQLGRYEKPGRGEVDIGGGWVYDQGGAFALASRQGWGLAPDDVARLATRLGKKPSRAQIRAEAIRQDIRYLQRYIEGDWYYLVVTVKLFDPTGMEVTSESVCGVESDGDYWETVAKELAGEVLHDAGLTLRQRAAKWRDALREARARKYWASRDVVTVGA